ncbi:hypothetical protein ACR9MF_07985 [Helicobacter pylori]
MGKESKLNTLESTDLALDLEKAQHRIQTLESNENTLKNDLNAKEIAIQAKEKELKELECNYHQNRERMQAENKHLKEQGLEKTYTQKDYERLKEQHLKEIEALKKEIQELEKTIKKNNEYTYTKRM